MIVIDGSHGEGGGQIVRSALTLSALTGQPTRIEAIRAGRSKPGLQAQHLTAVRAAAAICNAAVQGDTLGSMTLEFTPPPTAPHHSRPTAYTFDVAQARHGSSAGSVTLIFQTLLLPLALQRDRTHLSIKGGTHVPWSPPLHYLLYVFLPAVQRLGLRATASLERYGWYPAGGGQAGFDIERSTSNVERQTFEAIERGALKRVWGRAAVSNLPSHIAQRMANRACNILQAANLEAVKIEAEHVEATGPGAGIFLFAEYEHSTAGFCAYGRKGLPAEKVAEEACRELLAHHRSGAVADPHLADQLILPAAVLAHTARWTTSCVTQHLLTNAWVTQQFIPCHIEITGPQGQPAEIRISHV